jgi:hypothetical protein
MQVHFADSALPLAFSISVNSRPASALFAQNLAGPLPAAQQEPEEGERESSDDTSLM